MANETYQVTQGAALTINVTLADADGNTVTSYDGSQTLTTTVWPGGNRAASITPPTIWVTPSQGALAISISASQTAALEPGRYQLLTRLDDAGLPVDAYGCTIDILPSAGSDTAPKVYCDLNDLLKYSRGWLKQLQTEDDEAGFAEQRARARSWIEDLAHAHYRTTDLWWSRIYRTGQRDPRLQGWLDADALVVTDQARECVAKKTLAYVCEGQVGLGGNSNEYAKLARMYHSQADYLATCLTLELDTDADGVSDVWIDCTSSDPMYG